MPPAQGMTHIGRFFLMSSALCSLVTKGMHRPVEGKQYVKKILAINICESAGWQKLFCKFFCKILSLKKRFSPKLYWYTGLNFS